ncbi:MAG: hypothetical protein ACREBP_02070, partial [Sphingomicrobium sp.]
MGEHPSVRPGDLDAGCAHLLRHGYLVVEDALPRAVLEVLDQDLAPAPGGLWRYALPFVLVDIWFRPWHRIPGDDVDLPD